MKLLKILHHKYYWRLFQRSTALLYVWTPIPTVGMATASSNMGTHASKSLETLKFDNLALRRLPVDSIKENYTRQVPGACFSKIKPTPVDNPQTVVFSKSALELLGLSESGIESEDFPHYFCGNKLLPGSETAAHCYCGHQFGYFSGQLGDGAAIYLGEVINEANERWEIQLKGAGKTPYSRNADGRKVLRSSIREFLCSEAIHHLGIPTARAGSCVTSDSTVIRDIFYNGNQIKEKCTIVLRIAPTFLRFGSFEIFKPVDADTGRAGPSVGQTDILHTMLDYTIETFYPEIWSEHKNDQQTMYVEFYKEVVRRTARLVVEWQCVGWCHGVLNTDNMSILGLTIDYGPFGFMDRYDPDFICNSSDDGGRYTYKKQPEMCRWNCSKLAESIQEAVPTDLTKPHLKLFDEVFEEHYMNKMRKKFGLLHSSQPEDKDLVESFLNTMHETGADFTNCFRTLSKLPLPGSDTFDSKLDELKKSFLDQCCSVDELKKSCESRMDPRQLQMFIMLAQTNPDLLAQLGPGIKGLMQELNRLEKAKDIKDLTQDKKREKDSEHWDTWLSKYTDRLQVEAKGISDLHEENVKRSEVMNKNNPKFVLRNYIAQNAIEAAEKGDYSEVERVLKILETPFSEDIPDIERKESKSILTSETQVEEQGASCSASYGSAYDSRPPEWAADLRVS